MLNRVRLIGGRQQQQQKQQKKIMINSMERWWTQVDICARVYAFGTCARLFHSDSFTCCCCVIDKKEKILLMSCHVRTWPIQHFYVLHSLQIWLTPLKNDWLYSVYRTTLSPLSLSLLFIIAGVASVTHVNHWPISIERWMELKIVLYVECEMFQWFQPISV